MIDLVGATLGLITVLFVLLLLLKPFLPWLSCTLCAAVTVTWIIFFAAMILGYPVRIILAILIAQSGVGGMYAIAKRIPRSYLVFRLAYLLSLVGLTAGIAGLPFGRLAVMILVVVWGVSGFLFLYQDNQKFSKLVERIVACCKDW